MRYFLFFLCILLPQIGLADVRLAVLEFQGVGIEKNLLQVLSDKVRTGVLTMNKGQTIEGEELIIMTRENMLQVLKDQGLTPEDCTGECEVEVAKNIGADYVVSGNLTQIDDLYVLTIKLHETAKSNLLASDTVETKIKQSLLSGAERVGGEVFLEGLNLSLVQKSSLVLQEGFSGNDASWSAKNKSNTHIVEITSAPDGEGTVVMLDGKLLCSKTPCSKAISKGRHNINIQRERYLPWSQSLVIGEESRVKAILTPEFGMVHLKTDQKNLAFVLDNDRKVSALRAQIEVAKGGHRLSLKDKCFTGKHGNDFDFSISSGEKKEINFPVVPRPAGINVSVQDAEENDVSAKVYVDGQLLGTSPGTFTVGVCSRNIKVVWNGKSKSDYLRLKEKEVADVSLRFEDGKEYFASDYEAVLIPAGSYIQGCMPNDTDCDEDETPSHQVVFTKNLYMMKTEVTQGLYNRVMGTNPSHFQQCGARCPVENVSWYNAIRFVNKLSAMEGKDECYVLEGSHVIWKEGCTGWRLPTEAEWEYAARAGENLLYAGASRASKVSWDRNTSGQQTHPVAKKRPNAFGLHDMSGNVWEWCWDWHGPYEGKAQINPTGAQRGDTRILRGGAWYYDEGLARVTNRYAEEPTSRSFGYLGLRPVFSP